MSERIITKELIFKFEKHLIDEDLSEGTKNKYIHDIMSLFSWLNGEEVTREKAIGWKESLVASGYAPTTVNSMLSAANSFFKFMGWYECCVKFLRIQRRLFRDQNKELTQEEFKRLVYTAVSKGKKRQAMILETIGATGIRVSEVKYITVEAAKRGRVEISLKGKIRTILLPSKLSRKLIKYAAKNKIASGEIFITKSGKGISRKQIWAEMKSLCKEAGVEETKVFPHNLRHLFASVFYHASKDIARLADVLGHSSIETTRIYLLSTGKEHIRQLDKLGLVF